MRLRTHLGRAFDIRLPSHRFAVVASAAVAALGFAAGEGAMPDRLRDGFVAGLLAFLSWTLGRELDPDRQISAGIACVVAGTVAVAVGDLALGPAYLLLVTARILGRPTGRAPTNLDLAVSLVVAALVAGSAAGWLAGMALALAVARDVTLPDPAHPRQLRWALGIAVVTSVRGGLSSAIGIWAPATAVQWAVVAAGVAGAVSLLRPEVPTSVTDLTSAPLSPERLRWARGTVVLTLAAAAVVGGGLGLADTVAAWVTVAAAGGVRAAS